MFSTKKKVAVARIIAAVETRINLVEFDLVGGFGWDDGDVTLAASAEGSAAGTVAVCVGVSCGSGGVVRTLPGGTMLGGTLLGGTTAVGTFPGGTGLGGTRLVSTREGFGALGRGT